MTIKHLLLSLGLVGALAGTGCSNEIGELLECAQVCESHDDCVADAYDQTACTSACEDYADVSSTQEEQVFDCDDCYNEMGDACDDRCNTRCAGIVPAL